VAALFTLVGLAALGFGGWFYYMASQRPQRADGGRMRGRHPAGRRERLCRCSFSSPGSAFSLSLRQRSKQRQAALWICEDGLGLGTAPAARTTCGGKRLTKRTTAFPNRGEGAIQQLLLSRFQFLPRDLQHQTLHGRLVILYADRNAQSVHVTVRCPHHGEGESSRDSVPRWSRFTTTDGRLWRAPHGPHRP